MPLKVPYDRHIPPSLRERDMVHLLSVSLALILCNVLFDCTICPNMNNTSPYVHGSKSSYRGGTGHGGRGHHIYNSPNRYSSYGRGQLNTNHVLRVSYDASPSYYGPAGRYDLSLPASRDVNQFNGRSKTDSWHSVSHNAAQLTRRGSCYSDTNTHREDKRHSQNIEHKRGQFSGLDRKRSAAASSGTYSKRQSTVAGMGAQCISDRKIFETRERLKEVAEITLKDVQAILTKQHHENMENEEGWISDPDGSDSSYGSVRENWKESEFRGTLAEVGRFILALPTCATVYTGFFKPHVADERQCKCPCSKDCSNWRTSSEVYIDDCGGKSSFEPHGLMHHLRTKAFGVTQEDGERRVNCKYHYATWVYLNKLFKDYHGRKCCANCLNDIVQFYNLTQLTLSCHRSKGGLHHIAIYDISTDGYKDALRAEFADLHRENNNLQNRLQAATELNKELQSEIDKLRDNNDHAVGRQDDCTH